MAARFQHHAIAVSDQVHRIGVNPRDRVLFERLEPVVEDLGVGPDRIGRMRPLHEVFVEECHGRFDELPLRCEEQRKPRRSWLTQHDGLRLLRGGTQRLYDLGRVRQRGLTDDLDHTGPSRW